MKRLLKFPFIAFSADPVLSCRIPTLLVIILLLACHGSYFAETPKNLGSEAGETTEASDTRADRLIGDALSEKAYGEEMTRLGPEVVPILIKRYQEVPDKWELEGFKGSIIRATLDAVLRFEKDATHPLGTMRREEALRFFASLLSSTNIRVKRLGMTAIKTCAENFPMTEPFVIEATFDLMQTEQKSGDSLLDAIQTIGIIGHDEATAKRLDEIVTKRLLPFAGRSKSDADAVRIGRQAVKDIRARENLPGIQAK